MEKRASNRGRTLKAGTIAFGGGAINCTVRNMSQGGATLEVASQVGVPDQFRLVLDSDHASHACQVRWRKDKRIGVAFG